MKTNHKNLMVQRLLCVLTICVFTLLAIPTQAKEIDHIAKITSLEGEVEIFSNPSTAVKGPPPHARFEGEVYSVKKAIVGDDLTQGNILRTTPNGKAQLIYVNGDQIFLGPASAYRIFWEEEKNKIKSSMFKLLYGRIRNIISSTGPRNQLEVKAGNTVMGVRGTDFYVSLTSHRVEVSTLRGRVEVRKEKAEKVEVLKGTTASFSSGLAENSKTESMVQAPVIDVQRSSKEDISEIGKMSQFIKAEELTKIEDEKIKKLKKKALETELQDVKKYDLKLYQEVKNSPNRMASLAKADEKILLGLSDSAPKTRIKPKPSKDEFDESIDSYDRYFKKID